MRKEQISLETDQRVIHSYPFIVREDKEEAMVTMGQYILARYKTAEEAIEAVENKDWSLISGMIVAITMHNVEDIITGFQNKAQDEKESK